MTLLSNFSALKRGIFPDIKQYFRDLRSQRSQAIQTEDQYLYIHYAIVQLLFIKGVVSAHDIRGRLTNLAPLIVKDIHFISLSLPNHY